MTGYMISFGASCPTILPLAGETEIVGTFPTNVDVAKMIVKGFWIRESLSALNPETKVL